MSHKTKYCQDKIKFILENYKLRGPDFCSVETSLGRKIVMRIAHRNKITFRKKSNVNFEQFLDVKTPEVSYILGILWADGYVRGKTNFISIVGKIENMNQLESVFEKTGKWVKSIVDGTKYGFSKQMLLSFSSKMISDLLKECDYQSKSKSADKILSKIPINLRRYWFRGLIDGDGCFQNKNSKRRFSLCSTYDQDWLYFTNLLDELRIKYRLERCSRINKKTKKINSFSKIHIERLNDLTQLGEYIYKNRDDDKIGLDYKYEIWKSIKLYTQSIPEKHSKHKWISFSKSKKVNPWVAYYKTKFIGWYKSESEALNAQANFIKSI